MSSPPFRIGFGFDAHEFGDRGSLVLGGLRFKGLPALAGHSDGDALLHALIDALLGAAGLGDIGDFFPDTAKRYKGISSLKLLKRVLDRVLRKGFKPGQVDVTVMADRPRLTPVKKRMRALLARHLKIPVDLISIKAKTSEGTRLVSLRGGVAVWALATLVPRREGRS
ncbi:MAG: 2-C-methyl-D-erythritol 2,4-cyclodiphosphate synthase [Elusimicrobia bacterium]|nr:2-C-methyl-D-erythritol 2,4-cyclodiphosphate synthase [Candidatus Obscuribacterium magneticum]